MTVLLVLFLIVAFVGTDRVVCAAARRARAQRDGALGDAPRLNLPAGAARLQGVGSHGPIRP